MPKGIQTHININQCVNTLCMHLQIRFAVKKSEHHLRPNNETECLNDGCFQHRCFPRCSSCQNCIKNISKFLRVASFSHVLFLANQLTHVCICKCQGQNWKKHMCLKNWHGYDLLLRKQLATTLPFPTKEGEFTKARVSKGRVAPQANSDIRICHRHCRKRSCRSNRFACSCTQPCLARPNH